jgi:spermidine synthase
LLVAILGFVSAGCLAKPRLRLPRRQGLVVLVATACALCLFLLITSRASNLHRSLVGTRWGSAHEVVYERDSPYGNIAVSRLLGQYTVLANGVPYVTAPFPDILTVEEVVHLPLLFHPDPRRVLLIGAGLGGVSSELLKYPVECVDYAELDPALIEAVRALPTELTRSELSNERLHVHGIDGRLWLHR